MGSGVGGNSWMPLACSRECPRLRMLVRDIVEARGAGVKVLGKICCDERALFGATSVAEHGPRRAEERRRQPVDGSGPHVIEAGHRATAQGGERALPPGP